MALNPRPIRPWFRIDQTPPIEFLRFAGVHAILSPDPQPGFDPVPDSPVQIARVSNPMPRAWMATAPRSSTDADQAMRSLLADPDPMARPTVVKLAGTWPQTGTTLPVSDLHTGLNEISFGTTSATASVAVLADAWHPGWRVEVDGKPADALKVAGIFRGVALSPGSHQIVWRFSPWGWRWGWGLFAAGILFGLFMGRAPPVHQDELE
jgi:hypothetical protein